MILGACTQDSEPVVDDTWAQEAEEVVALLADAYDVADPYQAARFFTAGGTLDLTIWGYPVPTTPDEVVEIVRDLWFMQPDFANVRADHAHLLVRSDHALRHRGRTPPTINSEEYGWTKAVSGAPR